MSYAEKLNFTIAKISNTQISVFLVLTCTILSEIAYQRKVSNFSHVCLGISSQNKSSNYVWGSDPFCYIKEEEKTQKCFRTKGCHNSFTILVEYFTCKSTASGNFSTFSMSKNILAKYSAKILLEGKSRVYLIDSKCIWSRTWKNCFCCMLIFSLR